jgi:DNA polymerase-1
MTYADTLTVLDSFGILLRKNGPDKLFLAGPTNRLPPDVIEAARDHKLRLLRDLPDGGAEVQPMALMPGMPTFVYVTKPEQLPQVVAAVSASRLIAIDTETTGLDPRRDRLRLIQLACEPAGDIFLIDVFRVDPRPILDALKAKPLVLHNSAFDLQMLRAAYGFLPGGPVNDTMILSQLLHCAGAKSGHPKGFHGLKDTADREIRKRLDKAEQVSDWSAERLTGAQLAYAAVDVEVLPSLLTNLTERLKSAGMADAMALETRATSAVAWLEGNGVPVDVTAWRALAAAAERELPGLTARVKALTPPKPPELVEKARKGKNKSNVPPEEWNWNSADQINAVFKALGIDLPNTKKETLAAVTHPLAKAVAAFREANKRATTYGYGWFKGRELGGRVYADFRQIGAITGRMASGTPNMQNLINDLDDPQHRRCVAAPPGRTFVGADYSQLELRIGAKMTGDPALNQAYRDGTDVHTLTARAMTGRDEVTKAERDRAKPVNFGLIFGCNPQRLVHQAKTEYGIDMSLEDAERFSDVFFKTYKGVARWHKQLKAQCWRSGQWVIPEVRTLSGRRCQIKENDWFGKRANYGIQGSGGDAIKAALALLWERRHECPGAFPVLVVHDEIVIECDESQAAAVADWLTKAMVDALALLIAPVPAVAEAWVGPNWGDKTPVEKWLTEKDTEKPAPVAPPPPEPVALEKPAAPATTGRKPAAYKTVKPVIKWHGSKASLAKRIIALMPPHERYVEPFAGSAAILLARPPARKEVLADLNADLVNLYRVIQTPDLLALFLERARAIDLGPGPPPKPGERDAVKEAFEAARQRLPAVWETDVRRALDFFTVQRLSMSGRGKNVAPPSKTRLRRGMDERKSSFLTALDNLPAVGARLANVTLECADALKVIAQYDGPDTLTYCDPPYSHNTRASADVYAHEMDDGQHRQLLALLATLKGKVLLSGYSCPLYDTALAGWTRHTFDVANHGASGNSKRRMTETLWCNWRE